MENRSFKSNWIKSDLGFLRRILLSSKKGLSARHYWNSFSKHWMAYRCPFNFKSKSLIFWKKLLSLRWRTRRQRFQIKKVSDWSIRSVIWRITRIHFKEESYSDDVIACYLQCEWWSIKKFNEMQQNLINQWIKWFHFSNATKRKDSNAK